MRHIVRLFAILLLAILVVSCAEMPGRTKTIHADRVTSFILHIDSKFDAKQREVVIDAFEVWERDTHGIVRFAVSPKIWNSDKDKMYFVTNDEGGCTVDVYVASTDGDHPAVRNVESQPGNKRGNTLGFTSRSCDEKVVALLTDRITSISTSDPLALKMVTVHEAGHLIGLAHIPVPNESIMFPSRDFSARCPTRLDMAQFCMLYGCDARDMKYCD